jgi:hypothetical protein
VNARRTVSLEMPEGRCVRIAVIVGVIFEVVNPHRPNLSESVQLSQQPFDQFLASQKYVTKVCYFGPGHFELKTGQVVMQKTPQLAGFVLSQN